MRRLALLLLACALALGAPVSAAGTLTVTRADVGGGITKVTLAWTSDASGAVSGNAFAVPRGELLQVKFKPGAGGAQPSDQYDLTLIDSDSVDMLAGVGGNLSNSAGALFAPIIGDGTTKAQRVLLDGTGTLDLVVANAGNAKSGTVVLWIGR
jgi:hypothetical protein